MTTGRKKVWNNDCLENYDKAVIECKALAFRKDACFEKVSVRSKVTLRKVGVGLKQGEIGTKISLVGSTK